MYGCGNNENGQVGDGTLIDRYIPTRVKIKTKARLIKVSCGTKHSMALDSRGNAFIWGGNEFGQVAKNLRVTHIAVPTKIKISKIIDITCCIGASVVQTKSDVYAWGELLNDADVIVKPTKQKQRSIQEMFLVLRKTTLMPIVVRDIFIEKITSGLMNRLIEAQFTNVCFCVL